MMTKPSKTVQKACKYLKSKVRFETAGLILPGNDMNHSEKDTETIRQATKRYTETWVIPVIEAIEKGNTRLLQTFTR